MTNWWGGEGDGAASSRLIAVAPRPIIEEKQRTGVVLPAQRLVNPVDDVAAHRGYPVRVAVEDA